MPNRLRKQQLNLDETVGYRSPPRYAWEFCPEDARNAANKPYHPHPLRSYQVPYSPQPHHMLRPLPHYLETIEEERSRSFQARSYSLSSGYTETASSASPPWSHWSSPPSSVPESPPKYAHPRSESRPSKLPWWIRSPKLDDTTRASQNLHLDISNEATPKDTYVDYPNGRTTQKVRFDVPNSPNTKRLPKSPHPFGSTQKATTQSYSLSQWQDDVPNNTRPPPYEDTQSSQGISNNFHVDFPVQALPPHGAIGSEDGQHECDVDPFSYSALEPSPMISPASTFRVSEFSPVSPASVPPTRRSSLDSPEYAYKRNGSIGIDSPAFNLPSPVESRTSSQASPGTAQQLQQEKEWIWRLKATNVASKAKAVKAKEVDVGHKRTKSVGLGIMVAKPGTAETEYKAFPSPAVKSPMWEAVARRMGEGDTSNAQ